MCLPPARPARRATDRHGSQPRCKSEPARGCRFSRRVMNRAPKKSEPPGGKRSIPCDLWHPNLVRQMRDQGRRIDYLECRGGLERIRVFKPCPTELRNAGNCRPDYRTGVIRAGNSKLNRIRLLKSTKRQKPHCKEYGHVYLKNLEREARAALQKGLGGACDATRQAERISVVAMRKRLVRLDIPLLPRGYWAKSESKRKGIRAPKLPAVSRELSNVVFGYAVQRIDSEIFLLLSMRDRSSSTLSSDPPSDGTNRQEPGRRHRNP